jgi:hypothetical protein
VTKRYIAHVAIARQGNTGAGRFGKHPCAGTGESACDAASQKSVNYRKVVSVRNGGLTVGAPGL